MLWLALTCALTGTVHEDIKTRFRLDLPDGWKWNPQPGDTLGAWFRKSDTGALGNLGIRVIKLNRDTSVQKLIGEAESSIADEPGYRKLGENQVTVAGKPATRREYTMFVAGNDRTQRRVEDYFLQNGDTAFWLHFEALAEGFDLFADDMKKMLDSFVPIAGGQSVAVLAGKSAPLVGRWQKVGDPALIMELRADSTYSLAEASGTFAVEKNALILRIPNQGEERFHIVLNGDELQVSGPHLDMPIRYHRIGVKRAAKLAGHWKPRSASMGALKLSPGGQFSFAGLTGNYQQKGDLLVFRTAEGLERIYSYFLEGDLLKLSGADLPNEALFDRQK